MKNILVTGGAGYIGSHVVKLLGESGYNVTVYDNLSTGHKGAVTFGELVVGDLSDHELLKNTLRERNIEAVMHFAGSIKVPESVSNPIKYYKNNTENSLNLINACVEVGVEKFIFSSTAAVYGVLENGVALEETAKKPINPYGHSKLMTELMLKDISESVSNFNYIALRYFNVSGADPDGEIGQAFPEPFHLINVCCEAASGKRDKVSVFGTDYNTNDGTCIRDYIHVSDLAQAHLCALEELNKTNQSDVFNCGYGKGFSVKEVVKTVKEVTGIDYKVEESPRRDGDPAILVSNVDKIHKNLEWKPKYNDLETIIKTAYQWEKSNTLKEWLELK